MVKMDTQNLVSKQMAIDALEEGFKDVTVGINKFGPTYGLIEAVTGIYKCLIGKLPPVQPEILACGEGELNVQSDPRWIPVAERLPRKSGVYTVTDSEGDVVRFVFNTHSDSSRKYWYRCAKAWMPLPEPYKEVIE